MIPESNAPGSPTWNASLPSAPGKEGCALAGNHVAVAATANAASAEVNRRWAETREGVGDRGLLN